MSHSKKLKVSCALVVALLSAGCFKSETVVSRVDVENGIDKLDGVHYSLPRTVVKADIPFKREEKKPGELERFAPCFFSPEVAAERIREKSVAYSIEEPTLGYRVEPDPKEHFVVSVKGGFFEKKSLLLDYSPGGIIRKGEAEATNESLEFTLKAVKAATSIVTGIIGIPSAGLEFKTMTESAPVLSDKQRDMTPEEKAASDCFLKKQRVAIAEQEEAKTEEEKAKKAYEQETDPKKREQAKAAYEQAKVKTEQREKRAKIAETEATTVVTYLGEQAGARKTEREKAEEARKKEDEARKREEAKRATPRRRRANASKVGGDSTSRSNEESADAGGREEGEGSSEGVTRTKQTALSTRQPTTPADFKAEKLLEDYKRAAEVFEDIKKLENRRIELTTGGTGTDGLTPETLAAMLKQVDKALDERKGLFFGTSEEKSTTVNFDYVPRDSDRQTSHPLVWFAEDQGLCPTPESVKQGVLIPKKFKPKAGCPTSPAQAPQGMQVVYLYVEKDTADQPFRNRRQTIQQQLDAWKKKRGWYYRIPAKALVVVKVGTLPAAARAGGGTNGATAPSLPGDNPVPADLAGAEEVRRSRLDVAQLGVVVSAPASGAGRTNQSVIEYDDFGAIKNFKYASDPLLQQSYIEEAQGTAQTIIDARTKSNEAKRAAADEAAASAAAASDPAAKMKCELELLELQNKINEEKKKLDQADDDDEEDEEDEDTP